jgi:hypothetical protein
LPPCRLGRPQQKEESHRSDCCGRNEIVSVARHGSQLATDVSAAARHANEKIEKASAVVVQAVEAMSEIERSSLQIAAIADMIDELLDVAFVADHCAHKVLSVQGVEPANFAHHRKFLGSAGFTEYWRWTHALRRSSLITRDTGTI